MEAMIDNILKVISTLRLIFAEHSRRKLYAGLVLLIFCITAPISHADDVIVEPVIEQAGAMMVVKELHQKLLHIMQNAESLHYQGRYAEVKDVVTSRFDTALIAKVIMSRYWKQLDIEQKRDFVNLFQRLSVATYASRFDSYTGESFVELSTEKLRKGRLLIKTELQRPDDDAVKLDYLMHKKNDEWMIISVIANGVNDLSLKRAEYAVVIKDRGFQGLVDSIAEKISDMENDKDDE